MSAFVGLSPQHRRRSPTLTASISPSRPSQKSNKSNTSFMSTTNNNVYGAWIDLPIYETFGILKNSLKQFCETNISLWHDFFWCPWDVKCLRSRPALVTTYFFSSFTCALLSMVSWCKLGKINFCHRKVLTTVYQFNWIMSLIFRVNALLQKRVYSPIPSF